VGFGALLLATAFLWNLAPCSFNHAADAAWIAGCAGAAFWVGEVDIECQLVALWLDIKPKSQHARAVPLIIPTQERAARFRKINKLLAQGRDGTEPQSLAKAAEIMLADPEFQDFLKASPAIRFSGEGDLNNLAWNYLYSYLYKRDYVAAAMILWDSEEFTSEPQCMRDIWTMMFEEKMMGILGAGATGKTYGPSAWLTLDWLLDPEWTRIQVASNSEDHLKKNLFGDMVRLHSEAALPLPGTVDSESISLDKKRGMGIFIITLPGGPNSKGKIKGAHTKPRPYHPLFGRRSRIRMLIDEAQEVPANIFTEIPNRFSTMARGDVEHIKFIVAANPKDVFSEFGKAMKPVEGWDRLPTTQNRWKSEEGWSVLSINAMDHENVRQRAEVYKGFVTYDGVQGWLQRCHGDDNHPDMWTYVYGRFPPAGRMVTIISKDHLMRSEGEWIFDSTTENFAAKDPAFTGDQPTLAAGRTGRAVAWRRMNGERVDLPSARMVIQVDAVGIMPRGDTQDAADYTMSRLRELSVKPAHFGIDKTGVGQGEHDIIRRQWRMKVGMEGLEEGPAQIYGVHFSEQATDVKVADEDTEVPREMYDGIASEVWYAGSRLIEYDVVRFGRGVDVKTFEELSSRKGSTRVGKGRKQSVESKKDYKKRTGAGSPDRADAVLLLIQTARLATANLIPRAKDTEVEAAPAENTWGMEKSIEFDGINIAGLDGAKEMETKD
jgi:hypothetical protein